MAINFPSSPSQNDTYQDGNGVTWLYDGVRWVKLSEVEDVPTDSATTVAISSNWAYDHENNSDPVKHMTLLTNADDVDSIENGWYYWGQITGVPSNAYGGGGFLYQSEPSNDNLFQYMVVTQGPDDVPVGFYRTYLTSWPSWIPLITSTPMEGDSYIAISSNWASDHAGAADPHSKLLTSSEDLDDYVFAGGKYHWHQGSSPSNAPIGSLEASMTVVMDGTNGVQIVTGSTGAIGKMYIRQWSGGVFFDDWDAFLSEYDVDDTPVNSATTAPISSNWAYDHVNAADPHSGYLTPTEGNAAYVQKDSDTGSASIPTGTTAQRTGSPSTGDFRYNTDLGANEVYDGADWVAVAGGGLKPFMHVQDQKTKNTEGGTSSAGDNTRVLNTVLVNEISGASLASNAITLPAGQYYIEAMSPSVYNSGFRTRTIVEVDGTPTLLGPLEYTGNNVSGKVTHAKGRITLTSSADITVVTYCSTSQASYGLGFATNQDPYEVYTDLRIWQEDAVVQAPQTHQPINQPITGAYVTGGIFGGELVYVDDTDVDVNPVSCMADDLTTALAINSTTTVSISSASINEIYNFFLVKYSGATYGVEYDTDVNGANLPGTVVAKRWLGFVGTDASGDIKSFVQGGDKLVFQKASDWDLGEVDFNNIGNATAVDHSDFIPVTRVREIYYGARGDTSSNGYICTTMDGVVNELLIDRASNAAGDADRSSWGNGSNSHALYIPFSTSRLFYREDYDMRLLVRGVTLKR